MKEGFAKQMRTRALLIEQFCTKVGKFPEPFWPGLNESMGQNFHRDCSGQDIKSDAPCKGPLTSGGNLLPWGERGRKIPPIASNSGHYTW